MVNIYGSHQSSGRRCYWCLEEAGVKYEAHSIDMRAKEHKSEKYLKINPNGKVPALVDGDVTIWDSMAINFYICDAYKQDLIGSNVSERGPIRQWSFWALADLQPPLIDAFIQLMFVPEERRSQDIIDKALAKVAPMLESLNQELEGKSYLVANRFTLADLNTASVVEINHHIKNDLSIYPNITNWLSAMQDRPAYQRLIAKG